MSSSSADLRAPYKYERLSGPTSIRVLELLPECDGEGIWIHLHETSLQDVPPYQSLSYEWGEIEGSQSIRCSNGSLLVTTNLLAALRRLRYSTLRRYLWIDALCINQQDIEERTQQVAIMGQIYQLNHKVLIWLGEAGPHTSKAFVKLPELAQEQNKLEVSKEKFSRKYCEGGVSVYAKSHGSRERSLENFDINAEWTTELAGLTNTEFNLLEAENQDLWQGCCDLFSRTYFERVWIIQEVILSPTAVVLCGPDSCSWQIFSLVARYFRAFIKPPHDRILNLVLQIWDIQGNLSYKYPEYCKSRLRYISDYGDQYISEALESMKANELKYRKSLTFLLIDFSTSKARDPRDRVYALLSLLDEATQPLLKANYALTVGQVYQQATIIAFSQNLGILLLEKFAPPSLSHMPGTPSWVPDFACSTFWSDPIGPDEFCYGGEAFSEEYWDCFKDNFTYPPYTIDGDILSIYGDILDSVTQCTYITSPAEMCHFDLSYSTASAKPVISNLNSPDMSDFNLIGSIHTDTKNSLWLPENPFLEAISSPNGQAALHDNSTNLDEYHLACGRVRNSELNGVKQTDPWDYCFSQWDFINKSFRLGRLHEEEIPDTEYRLVGIDNEDEFWRRQYHWAQQKWSSQLYVHKHGRQLLRTRDGYLALGPIGISSVKPGDLIVGLGWSLAYFALRPLADGTYSLRGRVIVEECPAVPFKKSKLRRNYRKDLFNIR